jgi:hypothetical protein
MAGRDHGRAPSSNGALSEARSAEPNGSPESKEQGLSKISTHGDLIVFTLDEGALGRANFFDLAKRTLRSPHLAEGLRTARALPVDAEPGLGDREPAPVLFNDAGLSTRAVDGAV